MQCAYDIGMSFKDLVLTMSNLYIDWINKNNGVQFNVNKDDLINYNLNLRPWLITILKYLLIPHHIILQKCDRNV